MDREECEKICEENGFALSSMADKIIAAVNKKDGNCPCRLSPVKCPCPMMKVEVKEDGRCTCNLFIKKED